MQVSVENTSSIERRLKIQVPAEEVQKQINSRLREIGKQVKLKGFRPGRIPFSVLKQRFGAQAVQEVIQQTTQTSLQQAIQDESLRIAATPRIEEEPSLDDENGLEIKAIIEIYPELSDIDVAEIAIEKPDVSVTDSDIEEMLETLKKQRIKWLDVERKPTDGDQLLIEYSAEIDEGTLPEEGKYRLAIILGESGFDELEKVAKKMSSGDERWLARKPRFLSA
jgi:trigger factor